MKAAIRRCHYRRLQKKRSGYWFGYEIKHSPRESGMIATTPHPCSRCCCGNPRKYFNEKTMQERRKFQRNGHTED